MLDRHYVYKICSPSRCALQSGRNPVHVNVLNDAIGLHNPSDPDAGQQGIPRNMTTIAAKLAGAGYSTHAIGKWVCRLRRTRTCALARAHTDQAAPQRPPDPRPCRWNAGMAWKDMTPHGRGYSTGLVYFDYDTDFWTEAKPMCGAGKAKRETVE